MTERYTQEELKEYFYEALSMFNEVLDTDITPETVVIDFFTPSNGLAVYRSFCEKYFPDRYEKQHEAKGYLSLWVQKPLLETNSMAFLLDQI